MNRNLLCISVAAIGSDHLLNISTFIVDRDIVANADRSLSGVELKDFLLDAAEDVLDGDQGELFLDGWTQYDDPSAVNQFWKQFDNLVD